MFILVRYFLCSVAVTPVKHERDVIQVTSVLIILKLWENNGTEKTNWTTSAPVEETLKRKSTIGFCLFTSKQNKGIYIIHPCLTYTISNILAYNRVCFYTNHNFVANPRLLRIHRIHVAFLMCHTASNLNRIYCTLNIWNGSISLVIESTK